MIKRIRMWWRITKIFEGNPIYYLIRKYIYPLPIVRHVRRAVRSIRYWGYNYHEEHAYTFYRIQRFRNRLFTLFGLFKWVSVYHVQQCYGGPEEGGWWYYHYNCIESHLVFWFQAERTAEKLRSKYPKSNIPLTSVLSDGDYEISTEARRAESQTRERPIYC